MSKSVFIIDKRLDKRIMTQRLNGKTSDYDTFVNLEAPKERGTITVQKIYLGKIQDLNWTNESSSEFRTLESKLQQNAFICFSCRFV